MKRRLLLNLLFLSCLLLGRCQCDREEVKPKQDPPPPQLPPETMEGKGTFGCLVNGEVWLPSTTFWGSIQAVSSYHDDFRITANKYYKVDNENWYEIVSIRITNGITGPGTYILNTSDRQGSYVKYKDGELLTPCKKFITDSVNTGVLEITRWRDSGTNIVSGRFSFTMAPPSCDTIRVTNGRFDIGL